MKNFTNYIKEDDDKKIEKLKATMVSVLKKNKVKFKEIDVWDYGPAKGAEFLITISNGAVITYTPKDDLVRIQKNANPKKCKPRQSINILVSTPTRGFNCKFTENKFELFFVKDKLGRYSYGIEF